MKKDDITEMEFDGLTDYTYDENMMIKRELNFRLSQNFQLKEFFVSSQFPEHETEMRESLIRGDISGSVLLSARFACLYALQPLRDALGPVLVTSGYRTKALNQVIPDSNPRSWHLYEDNKGAVDLTVQGKSIIEVSDWLFANTQFERMLVYQDRNFVHLQFPTGFDQETKLIYYI